MYSFLGCISFEFLVLELWIKVLGFALKENLVKSCKYIFISISIHICILDRFGPHLEMLLLSKRKKSLMKILNRSVLSIHALVTKLNISTKLSTLNSSIETLG